MLVWCISLCTFFKNSPELGRLSSLALISNKVTETCEGVYNKKHLK